MSFDEKNYKFVVFSLHVTVTRYSCYKEVWNCAMLHHNYSTALGQRVR
jgi:hypothetical protein